MSESKHAPTFKREPVMIRQGWHNAGRQGVRLGPDVRVGGQLWTPVLWSDEDDPTFHKTAGLVGGEQ